MYTLLMKEFASEKHVKEEAKKIGLQFTAHETITIDDKKCSQPRNVKRNWKNSLSRMSRMGYDKKAVEPAKKAKEEPPKEAEDTETPAPAAKAAETPAAEEKPAKKAKPAQRPPKPVEEAPAAKLKNPKSSEDKEEGKTGQSRDPEPEAGREAKQRPDIKILGKIDLEAFEKKPSKKGKGKETS